MGLFGRKKKQEAPGGWLPVEEGDRGWIPLDENLAPPTPPEPRAESKKPSAPASPGSVGAPDPSAWAAPSSHPQSPWAAPGPGPVQPPPPVAPVPKRQGKAPPRSGTALKSDPRWEDPLLSPWAPPSGLNDSRPADRSGDAPVARAGEKTTTQCPRCRTAITYTRIGSPPWEVACPTCHARGRIKI